MAYADQLTPDEIALALRPLGEGVQLRLSNPVIRRLLAATFPDYRGRKVKLVGWHRPQQLHAYWDGGTRSEWRIVDPHRGVASATADMHNPFRQAAHAEYDLPRGILAVEHVIFQGHDLGIRIHIRPDDLALLTDPDVGTRLVAEGPRQIGTGA